MEADGNRLWRVDLGQQRLAVADALRSRGKRLQKPCGGPVELPIDVESLDGEGGQSDEKQPGRNVLDGMAGEVPLDELTGDHTGIQQSIEGRRGKRPPKNRRPGKRFGSSR